MANIFFYSDGIEVSKTRGGKSYRVELEYEDVTILVTDEDVSTILSMYADEDPNLIAILIAKIEYAYKCRNKGNGARAKRMENILLMKGICELLYKYHIETLIDIFTNLRWHEITRIFESNDPTGEMEKII